MALFSLNSLIEWTRRRGGDRLVRQREVQTTDGTPIILLNNDGNIQITAVALNGLTQVINDDFTQDVNVLTFTVTPAPDLSCVVVYDQSRYTDEQVLDFLSDSTKEISGKLKLDLMVGPSGIVTDTHDLAIPTSEKMEELIESCVVLNAAVAVREDITNTAAGDAILIRDGDTTIDTSKTAGSNETRLGEMKKELKELLRMAIANYTSGVGSTGNRFVSPDQRPPLPPPTTLW